MKKLQSLIVEAVVALSITACAVDVVPTATPTVAAPTFDEVPIEDPGGDTHAVDDVTWEASGGLPPFDFTQGDRAVSFRLEQVISSGQMYSYLTAPNALRISGVSLLTDVDSANIVPDGSSSAITVRGQGAYDLPDSVTVHGSFAHLQGESTPSPMAFSHSEARGAVALARQRARTRLGSFIGPEEKVAELARLRASGGSEQRRGPNTLGFTIVADGIEHELEFDETIGGVVGTRQHENGRPIVSTVRSYRRERNGYRLTGLTTTLYAADGSVRRQFHETYTPR